MIDGPLRRILGVSKFCFRVTDNEKEVVVWLIKFHWGNNESVAGGGANIAQVMVHFLLNSSRYEKTYSKKKI